MKPPFFARRSPLPFLPAWFINAMLVLCVVFFLVPFALRGARMSLRQMQNNVKDWLPSDFPETQDLEWFGAHFVGERFVVVSGPWCKQGVDAYELLVKKLRAELPPGEGEQAPAADEAGAELAAGTPAEKEAARHTAELEEARRIGDMYGLCITGDYHQDWGGRDEKWLQGDGGTWYFLTPHGDLYRWNGRNDLIGWIGRAFQRNVLKDKSIEGEHVATVGEPAASDRRNEFHSDPRKVTARLFRTMRTGPDVFEELTSGKGSHLWPIARDMSEAEKRKVAQRTAYDRLTGTLFGPVLPRGFDWDISSFEQFTPAEKIGELPADWRETYEAFVDKLAEQHDGDRALLAKASESKNTQRWLDLFDKFGVEPPARQTCIVLTLTEVGKKELARVVGRPLLGKPQGKLLDLAVNECGIPLEDLRLGGPPVDNVAIDEEGQITLVRLIGFSAAVGIGLSLLCFRSVVVTIMVFFVGGISAISSLSIVWWSGSSVDAVLLSMPSLVYVLGLSGAVHIVNYYREAARTDGLLGAPERALKHGWGPCTLAAFTTAIGLLSLYMSNIIPIRKFGLYSAIGVVATLALLFTYLPAALQIWEPGYHRRKKEGEADEPWINRALEGFWNRVGGVVIGRHRLVMAGCLLVFVAFALGLPKINTSVQLLKLFDGDAKIIRDYTWLEQNLGKLTPMELVIRVDPDKIRPSLDELDPASDEQRKAAGFQYSLLERMEMATRVQAVVEEQFGEQGEDLVGRGMSAATFAPPLPGPGFGTISPRMATNAKLEENKAELLTSDYLRIDNDEEHKGSELWRVSLRLGALNDVDYGQFVHQLKDAVEPVMTAYQTRDRILREVDAARGGGGFYTPGIVFLGVPMPSGENPTPQDAEDPIDQTRIFAETLKDLVINVGGAADTPGRWHDPDSDQFEFTRELATSDDWAQALASMECVVLVKDHAKYDVDFIRQHARLFIDARGHRFDFFEQSPDTTAADRGLPLNVVYTGVVPVVYKAQRTLLTSLVDSIFLAFGLIALVMMVNLRDRMQRWSLLNFRGGMLSMAPNVFPVVLIFGAMGHLGIKVDIGSMMTASVAMGVAVDDTIHFLTWFRKAIRDGADRKTAILVSYKHVATAMTQTTLIGGLGLAVFALSTFTPTQRFGTLMLTLLAAALVGDLIFLPAILAGPLGKYFCPRPRPKEATPSTDSPAPAEQQDPHHSATLAQSTLHSPGASKQRQRAGVWRRDDGHERSSQ